MQPSNSLCAILVLLMQCKEHDVNLAVPHISCGVLLLLFYTSKTQNAWLPATLHALSHLQRAHAMHTHKGLMLDLA
jgi:hypothetical protein